MENWLSAALLVLAVVAAWFSVAVTPPRELQDALPALGILLLIVACYVVVALATHAFGGAAAWVTGHIIRSWR